MEETFVNYLSYFFSHHPYWGISFAFLVAFLESLALVGSIIPGSVTLTAIGMLIGTGIIATWPTLTAAILGAFIGDTLSFGLGKYYRDTLLLKWPFNTYPKLITKGEKFFHRHGHLSIFIGRFVGPIRCILPVSAGILNMPTSRFILFDFFSAIFWAPTYLLPGILLGAASLELEPDTGFRLLIVAISLLIFIWCVHLLLSRLLAKLARQLRWFSLLIEHRFPRTYRHFYRDHQIRMRTLGLFISIALFAFLSGLVKSGAAEPINHTAWNIVQSFRFLKLDGFFTAVTLGADKLVLIPLTLIFSVILLSLKQRRLALLFLCNMLCTFALGVLIKKGIAHPRPDQVITIRKSASFPSGHTLFVTSLLSFFYLSMSHHLKRSSKLLLRKYLGACICIVMLSRLYLSAHWICDVLGGAILGMGIPLFITSFYMPLAAKPALARSSAIRLLISWLLCFGLFFSLAFKKELAAYQLKPPVTRTIQTKDWWHQTGPLLPKSRLNYIGQEDTTFNIQWLASADTIKSKLKNAGWQEKTPFSWISFIDRITHFGNPHYLPLFPKQYLFNPPELIFTKEVGQNNPILVIRLWPTELRFSDNPNTLYIGSIHNRFVWHLSDQNKTMNSTKSSIQKYLQPILNASQWRSIHYQVNIKHSPELESPDQFFLIKG